MDGVALQVVPLALMVEIRVHHLQLTHIDDSEPGQSQGSAFRCCLPIAHPNRRRVSVSRSRSIHVTHDKARELLADVLGHGSPAASPSSSAGAGGGAGSSAGAAASPWAALRRVVTGSTKPNERDEYVEPRLQ